ncbi:hypothetical protein FRB99_005130 [Tulasnella sp. 403]|nr:hypothetical protein FRB99_005130 [Tulasnella sp. 403]
MASQADGHTRVALPALPHQQQDVPLPPPAPNPNPSPNLLLQSLPSGDLQPISSTIPESIGPPEGSSALRAPGVTRTDINNADRDGFSKSQTPPGPEVSDAKGAGSEVALHKERERDPASGDGSNKQHDLIELQQLQQRLQHLNEQLQVTATILQRTKCIAQRHTQRGFKHR